MNRRSAPHPPRYGLQHQRGPRKYKAMSGAGLAMFGESTGVPERDTPVGARGAPISVQVLEYWRGARP